MAKKFNANALSKDEKFSDPSDGYANNTKYIVSFYHTISKQTVSFKAFITNLSDAFNSDWNSEHVYGRNDPILTFRNTSRSISLSFDVPASTKDESILNLSRIQKLTSFLYPAYASAGSATTITQSPLIRITFANIITNNSTSKAQVTREDGSIVNVESFSLESSEGLLGAITNLTVTDMVTGDDGILEGGEGLILPKSYSIGLDFQPIHEQSLGWTNGQFADGEGDFPYGMPEELYEQYLSGEDTGEDIVFNQTPSDIEIES